MLYYSLICFKKNVCFFYNPRITPACYIWHPSSLQASPTYVNKLLHMICKNINNIIFLFLHFIWLVKTWCSPQYLEILRHKINICQYLDRFAIFPINLDRFANSINFFYNSSKIWTDLQIFDFWIDLQTLDTNVIFL